MTTPRRPRPAATKAAPAAAGKATGKATTRRRRPAPRGGPAPRAPRPGRRVAAGLAASVALVGFLLVGVFPTQDWLAQREETRDKRAELAAIEADAHASRERIVELNTREEVEEQARRDYGMTRPGETPYQILPRAEAPVDLPDTWPFVGADDWLNR